MLFEGINNSSGRSSGCSFNCLRAPTGGRWGLAAYSLETALNSTVHPLHHLYVIHCIVHPALWLYPF